MWCLKDGWVPNLKKAALYKVLICDGKSNCDKIVDLSNQKHKCWFTLKWVVSKEDLAMVHIFIKGGHGTQFRVMPSALHILPAVCWAIVEADGLDYG